MEPWNGGRVQSLSRRVEIHQRKRRKLRWSQRRKRNHVEEKEKRKRNDKFVTLLVCDVNRRSVDIFFLMLTREITFLILSFGKIARCI